MRIVSLLSVLVLLSGCVSVEAGLKLAEFGVKVGFDIHNYVADKREESKQIIQESEK